MRWKTFSPFRPTFEARRPVPGSPAKRRRPEELASLRRRQPAGADRFTVFTVVCAPVYSRRDGLATQVDVGPEEGLKHESSVHCDGLVSIPKPLLTDYLSSLKPARFRALDQALRVALALA